MNTISIVKPNSNLQSPVRLVNDFIFCAQGTTMELSLKIMFKSLFKHQKIRIDDVESFWIQCQQTLKRCPERELTYMTVAIKNCCEGQVQQLLLQDGRMEFDKIKEKHRSILMGTSHISWLAYLWSLAHVELQTRAKQTTAITQLKFRMKLISSQDNDSENEAELELKIMSLSHSLNTIQSLFKNDLNKIGTLLDSAIHLWQSLCLKWEQIVSKNEKAQFGALLFWRSLISSYPTLLEELKKSNVILKLLDWNLQQLKSNLASKSSSLHKVCESLRQLFWLEIFLKDSNTTASAWLDLKKDALQCKSRLAEICERWDKVLKTPSMERGLNEEDREKLKEGIFQISSLLSMKTLTKSRGLSNVQSKGDELLSQQSRLHHSFQEQLQQILSLLKTVENELCCPTSIDKEVKNIWIENKEKSKTIQAAFHLSLAHPKIKYRAQHRRVFSQFFSHVQFFRFVI